MWVDCCALLKCLSWNWACPVSFWRLSQAGVEQSCPSIQLPLGSNAGLLPFLECISQLQYIFWSHSLAYLVFSADPNNVWYIPTFRTFVTQGGNAELPCLITAPEYASSVTLIMDDASCLSPGTNYSFSTEKGITLYNVQSKQKGYYRCQAMINGKTEKSSRIRLIVEEGKGLVLLLSSGRQQYLSWL